MNFNKWLDTLIEEKGYDTDEILEVSGPSGTNLIPLECLIAAIKEAPVVERKDIHAMLVHIDFVNGDCLGYLQHLAQAIAV